MLRLCARLPLHDMTLCVAHRGGSLLAPENTLAAFDAGIAAGADWVECDVHRSRDGALIVLHDADLRRTTDRAGAVGTCTLAEIKQANAASRFGGGNFPAQPIPTLEEVLQHVGARAGLQIEIKTPEQGTYPDIEERVLQAVNAHGFRDRSLMISFSAPVLGRCRAVDPDARTGLLISARHQPGGSGTLGQRVAAEAHACGASVVGLDYRLLSASLLAELRGYGLGVATWTVNEEADMRRCVGFDLEAVASDRPDLLRKVLDDSR